MSKESTPRQSSEQRRPLRSESFDSINDLETVGKGRCSHHKSLRRTDNDWSRSRRPWRGTSNWLRPRNISIAIGLLATLVLLVAYWQIRPGRPHAPEPPDRPEEQTENQGPSLSGGDEPAKPIEEKPPSSPPVATNTSVITPWEKPTGFKIIGLVFFGRPPVVEILDCYLKRNLVSNGGFLDEVLWVANTEVEEDLKYMDKLVQGEPLYRNLTLLELGYDSVWEHAVDDKNMFIKIDDDMVYFSDNAIPDTVYTKVKHPETLDVVANLVNSPETGWIHYHLGAVHAYLPELEPPSDQPAVSLGPKAWKASELPKWNGTEMSFPLGTKGTHGEVLKEGAKGAPPFKGHRWLPLPDQSRKNLYKTPIGNAQYNAFGPDWMSWALAAQVHYSLLENIEKNQLGRYYYGGGLDPEREGIWDMAYERMNINFMAIWGKDILDAVPFGDEDDERFLSETLTARLERPLLVNTHAVAAHFSFRTQHELFDTDLLSRYRAYANEKICTKNNQIKIPTDGIASGP